jgi:hypothetical protein
MPHLVSIYKNDFVKDICKTLASHPRLGRLPDPAPPNKRLPSRIRGKRSDARVAEGKDRFLNRNRCASPPKSFATSLPANC